MIRAKEQFSRYGFPVWAAVLLVLVLAGCSVQPKRVHTHSTQAARLQPVVIRHISSAEGGRELVLRSMSLIGTPYRYGGGDKSAGFDCSGMVQYLYRDALGVKLPRTARDIASVSRPVPARRLRAGDLVFFNTSGNPYSHMGLYIGNGEFIHAPSGNGVIRTARLDNAYFSSRFTGARTLFP